MHTIVDFHIHSKYSRATSRNMNLENLYRWGKIKGINVIGTGDFTHPEWFNELKEKLEPAEPGLFQLKTAYTQEQDKDLPENIQKQVLRFMLTAEISNIYSKGGKVRKMHNLLLSPSFEAASKLISKLQIIGNLKSDGRPILGLDSKELLRISLETDQDNFFIPAHIWTPWFSLFGSKSGFDSIQEAFEELSPHIRAIETGLSSDPFMNWRVDELKNISLISNSDAHSPQKMGREATVFDCQLSYYEIIAALKTNDQRLVGTIEFFPQEGKYHYDGHRLCKVFFSPEETKKRGNICPKCSKPLVLGVDYRISELASHPENYKPKKHKSVEYIIPLAELIAQLRGTKNSASKAVMQEYEKAYTLLGNEFDILRTISIKKIRHAGFETLATAIDRMRKGNIFVQPGYDGVYGTIKVFATEKDLEKELCQGLLL
jgi:DNA helicase-2/ATP-dependent DNA helicase PcrA